MSKFAHNKDSKANALTKQGGANMFGKKSAEKTKTAKKSSRSNVEASRENASKSSGTKNCSARNSNSSKSTKC